MSDAPVNPIAAMQARFNLSTQQHWSHFQSHRDCIEQLLLADGLGGSGQLCVLGAGNCNDLNLHRLCAVYKEVHLVDLDPAALALAVKRQDAGSALNLKLHAPIDLTGIATMIAGWPRHRPHVEQIRAVLRRACIVSTPSFGGPFATVLSPCLLSQIAGYAGDALGRDHPAGANLRRAIRDRHLRLMCDLLAPGGWGVLVTDVVSCHTVPGLARLGHDELPDQLNRLSAQRKTYPALDPPAILGQFTADPLLLASTCNVSLIHPWLWRLGPLRTFMVYGVRFRKRHGAILVKADGSRDIPTRGAEKPSGITLLRARDM